jgi:hypothetical protein
MHFRFINVIIIAIKGFIISTILSKSYHTVGVSEKASKMDLMWTGIGR